MSLARKLALRTAALVVGLALLGAASLWGLVALTGHFETASDQYERLRRVYEIGHNAASARMLSRLSPPDAAAMREHLDHAVEQTQTRSRSGDGPGENAEFEALARLLVEARKQLDEPDMPEARLAKLNEILGRVAAAASSTSAEIVANRESAWRHLLATIAVIATLGLVLVIGAVLIGVQQYRSVVNPLRRIEAAVSRIAGGDFAARVPEGGDREFARLAERFNRMTEELQTLYARLEEQVNSKSAQLVRSERLASVGYLAAGVAHEINNPLGIISGYAESALRQIAAGNGSATAKTEKALRIICDEAFRCKAITDKLLTLAKPGSAERSATDLGAVAKRVTVVVADLPQFRGRRLRLESKGGDDTTVLANEGEITQVLLNLICNALEAVAAESGEVVVATRRRGGWGVVEVRDNGRGMAAEVLAQVFEPFFTDKPSRGERGTGLGLSVAHAIAQQHGGSLRAHSDGPGRGSVFTLEIPLAESGR
jgi:two-component system NtrC family sensor kinase